MKMEHELWELGRHKPLPKPESRLSLNGAYSDGWLLDFRACPGKWWRVPREEIPDGKQKLQSCKESALKEVSYLVEPWIVTRTDEGDVVALRGVDQAKKGFRVVIPLSSLLHFVFRYEHSVALNEVSLFSCPRGKWVKVWGDGDFYFVGLIPTFMSREWLDYGGYCGVWEELLIGEEG